MSTMPGRTSGLGTSDSARTSGPPVRSNTIALIFDLLEGTPGSDPREHLRPLLQHLRVAVADMNGEVGVTGRAQLADSVAELGDGRRERQRADEVGRADLVLLGSE